MHPAAVILVALAQFRGEVRPIPIPADLTPKSIGHRGNISDPRFLAHSADGKRLASCDGRGMVVVWDVEAGRPEKVLDFRVVPTALALSPNGDRLALAGWKSTGQGATHSMNYHIRVLHLESGKVSPTIMTRASEILFSPDGGYLLSGTYGETYPAKTIGALIRWDLSTGAEVARVGGDLVPFRFTADGQSLLGIESRGSRYLVRLWSGTLAGESRELLSLGQWAVADLHPTGRMAAVASEGSISLVDTGTGAVSATLGGRKSQIRSVVFSPDGRTLAASEQADFQGRLVLWDVGNRTVLQDIPLGSRWERHPTPHPTPEGHWLVSSGGTGDIQVFEAGTGKVLRVLPGEPSVAHRDLFYSQPDGSGETTTWRVISMGPIQRDAAPPKGFLAVAGAGRDKEYLSFNVEIENHGWSPQELMSPSRIQVVRGALEAGGILLLRKKKDEGYPLIYLDPKGGGTVAVNFSISQKDQSRSMGVRITLKPHERIRAGLVFVVPKSAKESDLDLVFMTPNEPILLRAAGRP